MIAVLIGMDTATATTCRTQRASHRGRRFGHCSNSPKTTMAMSPSRTVRCRMEKKPDFHPEAIPCPYPHSAFDCDEILFYVRGNFTSRRGVGPGSISHHPAGVAHGPHPGAYEGSLGHKTTSELAVMMDTELPLQPTPFTLTIEDPKYHDSFIA